MRRNYHDGHHLSKHEVNLMHQNTADFLPVPKGSWKEANAKKQAINNGTLVFGTLVFLSSLFGVNNFFLNFYKFFSIFNIIKNYNL